MSDREKTIKRLEHLSEWLFHLYQVVCDGDALDYYDAYKTVDDAIDLLKNQEAKPPHYTHLEYLVNGKVVRVNHPECSRCFETGLDLWSAEIEKGQAYCKRCGQKVKWDD